MTASVRKTAAEYWKPSLVIGSCHGLSYDTPLRPQSYLSFIHFSTTRAGSGRHINPRYSNKHHLTHHPPPSSICRINSRQMTDLFNIIITNLSKISHSFNLKLN